jgi:hypothetical protein
VFVCIYVCGARGQTPESKKQEFRRYLEKSGVIDALTKGLSLSNCFSLLEHYLHAIAFIFSVVLVGLYEEPDRPQNAVEYIKRYMGAPMGIDVEALRLEMDQLRSENAELKAKLGAGTSAVRVALSSTMRMYTRIMCNQKGTRLT